MIEEMIKYLPEYQVKAINQLLNENMADSIIESLGEIGSVLDPLFHNTICPTIINGGKQINVIADEVTILLDGRMLPSYNPEKFLEEIKAFSGDGELSIIEYNKGPSTIDMGLFNTLSKIIRELDPEGIPIPYLATGVTDGRIFYDLGIHTYGFTPMLQEKNFNILNLMHSDNERIPIKALEFGTEAIYRLLQRF